MVNFGTIAADIGPAVCGTPANFNGFRVLAALLHGTAWRQPYGYNKSINFYLLTYLLTKLCGVEQWAPPIFDRAAITLGIGPYYTPCFIKSGPFVFWQ